MSKPSTPIEKIRAKVAEIQAAHEWMPWPGSRDSDGVCRGCGEAFPCPTLKVWEDLLTLAEALEEAANHHHCVAAMSALALVGGSDAEEAR